MAAGVRLIAPPNVATCLNDPSQLACDWVLSDAASKNGAGLLSPQQISDLSQKQGNNLRDQYRIDVFQDVHGTLLPSGAKLNLINQLLKTASNDSIRPFMMPIGLILVSFGFTLGYMLALLAWMRFMFGILNWMMHLFEALLAMPLLSLKFLKSDGEGFTPQEVQGGLTMLLGLVLRPGLMIFGLVGSVVVFNGIYSIVTLTFLPTVLNISNSGGDADDSVVSSAAYIMFYGTFAYTLANSAFKMIDLLPNMVMGWIGQRGESRTDDPSSIQQTAGGYIQTMAYSMPRGGMRDHGNVMHDQKASAYEKSQAGISPQATWSASANMPGGGQWVNPGGVGAQAQNIPGNSQSGQGAGTVTPDAQQASGKTPNSRGGNAGNQSSVPGGGDKRKPG
jgi:hypothetical protein